MEIVQLGPNQYEVYIPTNFDLITTAEALKKIVKGNQIIFRDRPREEWATNPLIPQTKVHFEEMMHHLSGYEKIIYDVETSGLSFVDPNVQICGHVFTTPEKSFYVPIRHITNEPQLDADMVNKILKNDIYLNLDKYLTWHNVKFDHNQLLKDGIDMTPRFKERRIGDTSIEMWLVDENQKDNPNYYFIRPGKPAEKSKWQKGLNGHAKAAKENGAVQLAGYSLKTLAPLLLGIPMTKFDDLMQYIGFHKLPIHFGGKYARLDGVSTLKLNEYTMPKMVEEKLVTVYERVEMPYARVVANMERKGIGVSTRTLIRIGERCAEEIKTLTQEVYELAGTANFKISSKKQLSDVLFNKLGYPILARTAKGAPKTDKATMEKLADLGYELPMKLDRISKLSKTLGTYVNGMFKFIDVDGRIHGTLDQTGTTTGRLSSYNPNLQNLPSQPIFKDKLDREQMIKMRKEIGDLGINRMFDFTVHFVDDEGEPLGTEEGWEEKCVGVFEKWFIRDAFTELEYLEDGPASVTPIEAETDLATPSADTTDEESDDDGESSEGQEMGITLEAPSELWGTFEGERITDPIIYLVGDLVA